MKVSLKLLVIVCCLNLFLVPLAKANDTLPSPFHSKWITVKSPAKYNQRLTNMFCDRTFDSSKIPANLKYEAHLIEFDTDGGEFLVRATNQDWGYSFYTETWDSLRFDVETENRIKGSAAVSVSVDDSEEYPVVRKKFDMKIQNRQLHFDGRIYKRCA